MTKNNHTQKTGFEAQTVVIYAPRGENRPEHLLAEAAIRFHSGILKGTTLVSFAIWKAQGQDGPFIAVTVPSREGETRFYEYLHGDLTNLKRAVRRAYAKWLGRQAGQDAAKALVAEIARRSKELRRDHEEELVGAPAGYGVDPVREADVPF